MPLISNAYGKGRVRVMRIHRDGDRRFGKIDFRPDLTAGAEQG